jgi:hypothetical protein
MSHLKDNEVFGAKSDVLDEMTTELFTDLQAPHQETAAQQVEKKGETGHTMKNVMWGLLGVAAVALAFK